MRRYWSWCAILMMVMALFTMEGCVGCTKVEPGFEGILVNNYGSQKGVEDFPVQTGRVWYNPLTTDVYKFPTFMQRYIWTASEDEGSPTNESISFNSSEGATINTDVAIAIAAKPGRSPYIFMKYRKSMEEIVDGFVRDKVRAHMNAMGSTMKAVDVFGSKKQEFTNEVNRLAQTDPSLSEDFAIDSVNFISDFRVNDSVQSSINAVLSAAQLAIQAETKVKQATAEADQAIQKARGESESRIKNAEGEAKSIEMKATADKFAKIASAEGDAQSIGLRATAQASANKTIKESLTPDIMKWQTILRWNGKVPMFTSGIDGTTPFVSIPASTEFQNW